MHFFRALAAPLLLAGLAFAADPAAIDQAAKLVEQKIVLTPQGQDLEFRLLAAQTLQPRYPKLARKSPAPRCRNCALIKIWWPVPR